MSGVNSRSAGQQWAGFASIGAGIIHGAAIGLHAEHAASSRVFLVLTLLQVGWEYWRFRRSTGWYVVSV